MTEGVQKFTNYIFMSEGDLVTSSVNLGDFTDPDMIVQLLARTTKERGVAPDSVSVPVCFFITEHPGNDANQPALSRSPYYYLGGIRCTAEDVRDGVVDLPEAVRMKIADLVAGDEVIMVSREGKLLTCKGVDGKIMQWPPATGQMH